jgi:tetratricopeptide (TPR) repeat protein
MAIKNFQEALELWRKEIHSDYLRPEYEMYFGLNIGQCYMDWEKKLKALTVFQNARKASKLQYNHPDQAFPYMFLGSVFFELNEPLISLRCYLMARNI